MDQAGLGDARCSSGLGMQRRTGDDAAAGNGIAPAGGFLWGQRSEDGCEDGTIA